MGVAGCKIRGKKEARSNANAANTRLQAEQPPHQPTPRTQTTIKRRTGGLSALPGVFPLLLPSKLQIGASFVSQSPQEPSLSDSPAPPSTKEPPSATAAALAPGQLRVIKRNGRVVAYDQSKIELAITKAFLDVQGRAAAQSTHVHDTVRRLAQSLNATFQRRLPSGGAVDIEEIQDQVELALMRSEEHAIARSYVLYREERAKERKKKAGKTAAVAQQEALRVTREDGSSAPLDQKHLEALVAEACAGLPEVQGDKIITEARRGLYDGIPEKEVQLALVMTASSLIEEDPDYSYVAGRLLLDKLRCEVLPALGCSESTVTQEELAAQYPQLLQAYVKKAVQLELLDPDMVNFDLDALGRALVPKRDMDLQYMGLQNLYDRYFLHDPAGVRLELPQLFFMRVAMGLSLREVHRDQRAVEFYELLSRLDYMCSTPTLFNAGTQRPQLSSCYLSTVPDDLNAIFGALRDNAMLSKWAGGLGNDWTPVRALGSYIKGTNGKSQGVVPFLKVANDTAVAVNQGGRRKGALCCYLETWHLDIEEFLELRRNTGDDRRRTHDMHTAHWIPDLFMKRVLQEGEWTLFSPNDVPDLHDCCGKEFERRYEEYEKRAAQGDLPVHKKVAAKDLWRRMLEMLFETGHPWITFKDACNLRSPQQHVGVVHSSNLCTEITLNTSEEEIAVCNLGSVNLAQHVDENGLNREKLRDTVLTAVRMLDNIIDMNYYAVLQSRTSNLRHRPVGLGMMGFQDALYIQGFAYGSEEAVQFADDVMEAISYCAIEASSDLALERGSYESYPGSLWSKGVLPLDTLDVLAEQRGEEFLECDRSSTADWEALREKVRSQGMRNSNVMAIAPTATIANIVGVTQSIEPTYQNLYTKSNLSGEFTVINPYLVRELKQRKLWDAVMVNDLKHEDGSVQRIDRIPRELRPLFATAFELHPRWLVEAAARRQKWIDQGQSLNLYIAEPDGKKLNVVYQMAWQRGLKTTYYLRTLAATGTEKSTVESSSMNAVAVGKLEGGNGAGAAVSPACTLEDPDCEACQ